MEFLYSKLATVWQSARQGLGAFLCLALLSAPAHALPQEYSITALGVDTSRIKAEAYAMDYALKRAVFLAASKMGISDPSILARIPPEKMSQIIRGATVERTERKGDKTYQQIRVTINEDQLRAALKLKAQEAAAEQPIRSVLVIPVLVGIDKTYVWEKENPLRAPLAEELLRQSHGLIILPSGDLQDLRLIDRENALKVKMDDIAPMFTRYGVKEVVIAAASPGAEGTETATHVVLHRVSPKRLRDELLEIPPANKDEAMAQRVNNAARAVATAAMQIASASDESEEEKLAKATKIPLRLVYATPRELAKLTDTIRHAPGVLKLELPAIMLNNVNGVIYYDGDKETLRKQLAPKGVVIRDLGKEWTASAR